MTWIKVEGRSTPLADDVRISFRPADKRRHLGHALNLGVGFDVMTKLGWNAGIRVDLYWGHDKNIGWFKIVHSERGRLVTRRKGDTPRSAVIIACGQLPAYIKRQPLPSQHADFSVVGGDLLVRLPDEMIVTNTAKPRTNGITVDAR